MPNSFSAVNWEAAYRESERRFRLLVDGATDGKRTNDALRASLEALYQSEAQLRDTQTRLEAALSAGDTATCYVDLINDRVVGDANLARLLLVSPEKTANWNLASLMLAIHEDDRPRVAQHVADTFASNENHYEDEYRVAGGRNDSGHAAARWLSARARITRDAAGTPLSVQGVLVDITERVERERRDQFLADLAERARILTEPDAVIADAVRSLGEFLGVARCVFADIDIKADTLTVHPDYRADPSAASIAGVFVFSSFGPFVVAEYAAGRAVAVDDVYADSLRAPEENRAAYEAVRIRAHVTVPVVHFARLVSCISAQHDKPRHWTPEEIELLKTVVGRTWLTVEVLRQQRALSDEAENRRRVAERERVQLADIFTCAPAFMAAVRGPRHVFEMVNEPYYQLIGRRDVLGKTVAEALPEVVEQGFINLLDHVYQTGEAYVANDTRIFFQGEADSVPEEHFLDFSYQPMRDENGTVSGILAHGIDITERKRAEDELRLSSKALRVSENRLREVQGRMESALLSGDIGTWSWDMTQKGVWGDATMAHLYSLNPDDLAAARVPVERFFDAVHKEDRTRAERSVAEAVAGRENYEVDYRVVLPDGSHRWVAARGKVVLGATGTAVFMAGAVVDITERVERERERERERLLDESRAHAEREALLNRIGAAIRATDDPEEVQSAAVALLGEALGLDLCHAASFDPARDEWHVAPDWHRSDLPALAGDYPMQMWRTLSDEVAMRGGTAVFPDVTAQSPALSDDARTLFARMNARAYIMVPSYDALGAPMAVLAAAMSDEPRYWTPEEVGLIEATATLVRTASESARVQQRERNISQQLQDALIPPPPTDLPGLPLASFYRPALGEAGVGGDFFDVFPVMEGCTALVVADLSGKGLAAASQVAMIRNMLRYAVYSSPTLSQAVTGLHRSLVQRNLLTGFATLFVGIYDAQAMTITYVNGGQEPGLIWRAATSNVEMMPPTGPVLGGFGDGDYEEAVIGLSPGDVFALFTDGLTEVGPNRKEQLSIEGVIDILRDCCTKNPQTPASLPPPIIVQGLIAGVDDFARGGTRDDIALLIGVVHSAAYKSESEAVQ